MSNPDHSARSLTFPELIEARRVTEIISNFLQQQLVGYLETLRPLFEPERLLGKYAGSKNVAPFADKALAHLQQNYAPFVAKPFHLPVEFDTAWLTEIDSTLELHRWEYTHEARSGGQTKAISITHPAKWALTFKSGCTLGQFIRSIGTKEERRSDATRKFVINALVLNLAVSRSTGLAKLLSDLRYQVAVEDLPQFGKLPLVTITSVLPSFLPSDELMIAATAFSGVSVFNELVDISTVLTMEDPLKVAVQQLAQGTP